MKIYGLIMIATGFFIFLISVVGMYNIDHSTHNNDHSTHNTHTHYNGTIQRAKVDELVKIANDVEVTKLAMKIQKDGLITKDELELLRIKVKISIIQKYQ